MRNIFLNLKKIAIIQVNKKLNKHFFELMLREVDQKSINEALLELLIEVSEKSAKIYEIKFEDKPIRTQGYLYKNYLHAATAFIKFRKKSLDNALYKMLKKKQQIY